MMTGDITSVNYKITVDDGILYMMGIAKNKEELQKVIDIIQATDGIKKIISHVRKSYEN